MTPRRIILHWTGGGPQANAVDRSRYHYLVQQDGSVVMGVPVEANMRSIPKGTPRSEYAAHTGGMNSWSVGVALCGMFEAKEGGPYGPHPITASQTDAACALVARLCAAWGLPVTADTVFTHAEAWSLHGVQEAKGKWDINVFPWEPDRPDTGFTLRSWINGHMMDVPEPELRDVRDVPRPLRSLPDMGPK